MGDLSVRSELYGLVVDDQVLAVRGPIVVGDWPTAEVSFPGASIRISRSGTVIRVLGKELAEGESTSITLGAVHVHFEHTSCVRPLPLWESPFDGNFLAVALVMIAVGTWFDAAEGWLDRLPINGTQKMGSMLREAVEAVRSPNRRQWSAAVSPLSEFSPGKIGPRSLGEGPRHLSDDGVSGTAYYRWFRTAVPTDPLAIDANDELVANPLDAEARRVVARAAYNADHFQLAAWHYSILRDRFPDDAGVGLRLAWAERRQGNHRQEMDLYEEVLNDHPNHPIALGGLTMAQARTGEVAMAQSTMSRLEIAAPAHPYTELTAAVLSAKQGNHQESVECLRRTIVDREQLDSELQIEIRRDISTDPLFAALRADWPLRSMLRRYLGAAAPRRLPARPARSR
jgi:hypothetical protein